VPLTRRTNFQFFALVAVSQLVVPLALLLVVLMPIPIIGKLALSSVAIALFWLLDVLTVRLVVAPTKRGLRGYW
jgi:hypothetical protein